MNTLGFPDDPETFSRIFLKIERNILRMHHVGISEDIIFGIWNGDRQKGETLIDNLRQQLKKTRSAKSRLSLNNVLEKSIISDVSISLLAYCHDNAIAPSRNLVRLMQELLDVDKDKAAIPQKAHASLIARQLRQQGKGINQIARELGVRGSTVSGWLGTRNTGASRCPRPKWSK